MDDEINDDFPVLHSESARKLTETRNCNPRRQCRQRPPPPPLARRRHFPSVSSIRICHRRRLSSPARQWLPMAKNKHKFDRTPKSQNTIRYIFLLCHLLVGWMRIKSPTYIAQTSAAYIKFSMAAIFLRKYATLTHTHSSSLYLYVLSVCAREHFPSVWQIAHCSRLCVGGYCVCEFSACVRGSANTHTLTLELGSHAQCVPHMSAMCMCVCALVHECVGERTYVMRRVQFIEHAPLVNAPKMSFIQFFIDREPTNNFFPDEAALMWSIRSDRISCANIKRTDGNVNDIVLAADTQTHQELHFPIYPEDFSRFSICGLFIGDSLFHFIRFSVFPWCAGADSERNTHFFVFDFSAVIGVSIENSIPIFFSRYFSMHKANVKGERVGERKRRGQKLHPSAESRRRWNFFPSPTLCSFFRSSVDGVWRLWLIFRRHAGNR